MRKLLLAASLFLLFSCSTDTGIEKPQAGYSRGDYSAVIANVADPNKMCETLLGPIEGKVFNGCYVPSIDLIVLPYDDGSQYYDDLKAHEEAHARGWRHAPK